MLNKIKNCIRRFIPYEIIFKHHSKKIRNYFLSLNTDDPEILEIISYFNKYQFSVFPYEFSRKYNASNIDVFFDKTTKTQYVMHDNKKLYFPEDWEIENIRAYYNGLRIEQDIDSPHRYEINGFIVQEGDVIADVGAAEGIWALTNAEKAGKIYLFEYNIEWIKALEKTFEPGKKKLLLSISIFQTKTIEKT